MTGVAWWTCALFALVGARIYERCELAQDLQRLNVQQDHIATWVCIAFHESRFDTAAQNPYSGDHGLLQISELYWCGSGKVCGVPCSAFRDDDISDDVECALQIHEEHTRLQGDGFLAWVVYAQHCKHNTKKYLADCDVTPKNLTEKTLFKQRALAYNNLNSTDIYRTNIDDLKPPYLTIGSFLRGSYGNELEENYIHKSDERKDYIFNIDELTLPVFNKKSNTVNIEQPKTTRTTVKPPVMPNRIQEINQFRYSALSKTSLIPRIKDDFKNGPYTFTTTRSTTVKPSTIKATTGHKAEMNIFTFSTAKIPTKTQTKPLATTTTTYKPRFINSLPYIRRVTTGTPTASRHRYTTSNRYVTQSTTPRMTTKQTTTLRPRATTTMTPTTKSFSTPQTTKYWKTSKLHSSTMKQTTTERTTFTPKTTRSTKKPQSVFDLYLNPTERPKLAAFSFPSFGGRHSLKIFSDGTTPVPDVNKAKA